MKKIFSISVILTIIVIINSCTNYNKQAWLDASTCNTTAVTYTNTVKKIMDNNNCSSCHAAGGTPPELSSYATVKAETADTCFIGSMKHSAGSKPMPYPQGSPKISDCSVLQIEAWIAAGLPE
jgi:mono/diheme cytochrome c family protein